MERNFIWVAFFFNTRFLNEERMIKREIANTGALH